MSARLQSPRNTIGNRLILSVGFIAGLAVSIGIIAFVIWEMLDDRVNLLVNQKLPTLTTNYQLEHYTAQIHTRLNAIIIAQDPDSLPEFTQRIEAHFNTIDGLVDVSGVQQDIPIVKQRYARVQSDIQHLIRLKGRQLEFNRTLNQLDERLFKLNQGATARLNQLQYDIESYKPSSHIITQEYGQLQRLNYYQTQLFAELHIAVRQAIADNPTSTAVIRSLRSSVARQSTYFSHYSSFQQYKETLSQLFALIDDEGVFMKTLELSAENSTAFGDTYQTIQNRLEHIEDLLLSSVEKMALSMTTLNQVISQIITGGNMVIFIMMCITIFSAITVAIDLISKGIVKRLNQLSTNLMIVNQGNLSKPVRIEGDDEIADIGHHLEKFRKQMVEIEQTNALNLINHTQASLITCTTNGLIQTINPSAMRLFSSGRSLHQVYLWHLFDKNIMPRLRGIFSPDSSLLRRGAMTMTFQFSAFQSEKYLRLDFRLFEQNRDHNVIITITDITEQEKTARWLEKMVQEKTHSLLENNAQLQNEVEERKKTEQVLLNTQNDLLQAAKMATVGQTMTSLAHELNQPLSAISTYLYSCQLAIDSEQYNQLPNQLQRINAMVERISQQTTNLRNFSKKNQDNATLSHVTAYLAAEQSWAIVESRARNAKVSLNNNLPKDLEVIADLVQLEQVFVNLMVNSIDAIAKKKRRTIDINHMHTNSRTTLIAISDTGDGFQSNIINQLFTPFTTTKDVGLGLGLNICRNIMSRLKGNIFLASTLDGGAMVVLELFNNDLDG
ncbi:ATP-binding protein [Thaumasiovibrio sp. DFM-14]|uniref:ATP-binding protein n=1 Tax=Thaumasiovibrio sp. DFM-14 TaxID=3384792 RepID=UPI0039A224E6